MRRRDAPLRQQRGGHWFTVEVGGRGEHAFRVPRAMVLGELVSVLRVTNIGRTPAELKADLAAGVDLGPKLRASEEAVGACIGACWRHATLELETDRHSFADDTTGLRRFGNAVLDELEDAGYSPEDVVTMIEAVTPRLLAAIAPAPAEVAARAETFRDG